MADSSQVTISLTFEGDPFKFWEILKAMKKQAESDGVGTVKRSNLKTGEQLVSFGNGMEWIKETDLDVVPVEAKV